MNNRHGSLVLAEKPLVDSRHPQAGSDVLLVHLCVSRALRAGKKHLLTSTTLFSTHSRICCIRLDYVQTFDSNMAISTVRI